MNFTNVVTTYGSHISKDTTVIMNNVTVSFLCLLAAPWCGGRAFCSLLLVDLLKEQTLKGKKIATH